jgi:hypothetical protein
VLRGDGELSAAIEYVMANPVQADLADDPSAYPFLSGEVLKADAGGDLKVDSTGAVPCGSGSARP